MLKLQEATERKDEDTHEGEELMMHEVVYLNEKKINPTIFEADQDTQDLWYLDNGASNHMSGNRVFFYQLDKKITGKVRFGDDSRVDIRGKGSIRFTFSGGVKKILKDVYYIHALKSNIVNLGQATEAGCEIRMKDDLLMLYDREGRLMVETVRSRNRLYKVTLSADNVQCLQVQGSTESAKRHARLGHVNIETMKLMIRRDLAVGLPKIAIDKETCESCLRGKQTRQPFPQATSYLASHPLELIHGDLCGPITPTTPGLKRYVFVLIDDYSRYMWTILLKQKSEAFEKFKRFKTLVEQEIKAEIQTLRTDRGGEFNSHEFNAFCDLNGIKRHLTAPYSPQ